MSVYAETSALAKLLVNEVEAVVTYDARQAGAAHAAGLGANPPGVGHAVPMRTSIGHTLEAAGGTDEEREWPSA